MRFVQEFYRVFCTWVDMIMLMRLFMRFQAHCTMADTDVDAFSSQVPSGESGFDDDDDSKGFHVRESTADAEVPDLEDSLAIAKLEGENETSSLHHQCSENRAAQKEDVEKQEEYQLVAELDKARTKLKALEDSYELLSADRSTLVDNLEKLSDRNMFLEKSLFNTNVELETLRATSEKELEELKTSLTSAMQENSKTREELEQGEKLISELYGENIELEEEANRLSDQMRMGIAQLLKVLGVDLGCEYDEIDLNQGKLILHCIHVKFNDIKNSLIKALDEKQKLMVEKSLLVTLLGHFKQEVVDLKTLIFTLQQEFNIGNHLLSSLLRDMQNLLQSNGQLIQTIREGNLREDLFSAQVANLKGKLVDMQLVCKNLEEQKGIILEEKRSLLEEVLYFKNCAQERSVVVRRLTDHIDKLCSSKDALQQKLQSMKIMYDEMQEENMSLKVSLETCEHELKEAAEANSWLQHQLSQTEVKLTKAETLKDENDIQVRRMSEKCEEAQNKLEMSCLQLQKGKDDVELWENVAAKFFTELQANSVREIVFKEKLSDLIRGYEGLGNENFQIKTQLAGYIPAFDSVMNCVASFENVIASYGNDDNTDGYMVKDTSGGVTHPDAFSGLRDVALRTKAIENSVIRMMHPSEKKQSETSLDQHDSEAREFESLRSQQLSRSSESTEVEELRKHVTRQQQYTPSTDSFRSNGEVKRQLTVYPFSDSLVGETGGLVDKLGNSKRFVDPLKDVTTKKKIVKGFTSKVQKIQFHHLLKLNRSNQAREVRKNLHKDYLYGGVPKMPRGNKKSLFCRCFQHSTSTEAD